MNTDWIDLNMQQNFNGRNDYVHIVDHSRVRVGKKPLDEQTVSNQWFNKLWLAEPFKGHLQNQM